MRGVLHGVPFVVLLVPLLEIHLMRDRILERAVHERRVQLVVREVDVQVIVEVRDLQEGTGWRLVGRSADCRCGRGEGVGEGGIMTGV